MYKIIDIWVTYKKWHIITPNFNHISVNFSDPLTHKNFNVNFITCVYKWYRWYLTCKIYLYKQWILHLPINRLLQIIYDQLTGDKIFARNTTVWKEYNSLNTNCLNSFSQLLYSSFYMKMIIIKSPIIFKYWRNIANYKIYIHFYLLKLPACGFEGSKNNINRCWIWNATLPYKFVSRVTTGFLQINLCMKSTLPVTLQTKFQYSSIAKCIYSTSITLLLTR